MLSYSNSHKYTLIAVKKTDVEKLNDLALTGGVSLEHITEDNVYILDEVLNDARSEYESSYDSSNC